MSRRARFLVSTVLLWWLLPDVALADNCSNLGDCYGTLRAALAATVGVSLFALLISIGLDFIPGVGTVKGLIEAITGEDLITEQELAWWERLLGVIPFVATVGGVVAGTRIIGHVDDIVDVERAADRAGDIVDAAADVPTIFGPKIEKQLGKRGWTKESVNNVTENPNRTVPTTDTRHLPEGGRANEPATAYINEDGSYVVRNDRTGDIVQVSNRNDPNWKSPF